MKSAICFICLVALSSANTKAGPATAKPVNHSDEPKPTNQPAPLNKDGTVAETPEVQEARAEHLAAIAAAKAGVPERQHAGWVDWDNDWDSWYPSRPSWWNHGHRWNLQPAPLNPDGTVAETPEVQVLRARHLAALAAAEARALSAPKWYPGQGYWLNPKPYYGNPHHG